MRFEAAWAAQLFAALFGGLQAYLCSFRYQRGLKLGNGSENVKQQLACRRTRIDSVRDRAKAYTAPFQIMQEGGQVFDRAAQPISFHTTSVSPGCSRASA